MASDLPPKNENANEAELVGHSPGEAAPQPAIIGQLPPGLLMPGAVAGPFVIPFGVQQQVQLWQGQFPPPEAVEHYDRVQPGAFDRIIAMAERQQEAQIELSKDALKGARADASRGQWLGFLITGASIGGAIICAFLNQPWIAGLLTGVPVLAVAKALVDSTRKATPITLAVPSEQQKTP